MGDSEADKLEKYLAEKAKQDQEKEQASEPLSAYDACVLKESSWMRKLMVKAKEEAI